MVANELNILKQMGGCSARFLHHATAVVKALKIIITKPKEESDEVYTVRDIKQATLFFCFSSNSLLISVDYSPCGAKSRQYTECARQRTLDLLARASSCAGVFAGGAMEPACGEQQGYPWPRFRLLYCYYYYFHTQGLILTQSMYNLYIIYSLFWPPLVPYPDHTISALMIEAWTMLCTDLYKEISLAFGGVKKKNPKARASVSIGPLDASGQPIRKKKTLT